MHIFITGVAGFLGSHLAEHFIKSVLDYIVKDCKEDLDFLNAVYKKLEPTYGENFTLNEIGKLLLAEPELLSINEHCIENTPRP